MNIVVLGPGAIGSLWAYNLMQAGHNVSVWSRSSDKHYHFRLDDSPSIQLINNDIESLHKADLILVTVKAWQVEAALQSIAIHIAPETVLMLMHNGMGSAERLPTTLTQHPILLATTTHGAYKPSVDQVLHTGLGATQVGPYNELGKQCSFVAEVLQHALTDVNWNEHIEHALWQKLAVNCAINPLTAIHQIKNGKLADPRYHKEITGIVSEVVLIMNAKGFPAKSEPLCEMIYSVINATAENYSSMHQDVMHHRPSEIDFITGYLLDTAKAQNISAPFNQALFNEIKEIEKNWTP
ncbi:2-dehydropantoate 2-reductase [Vibrio sonorensis]|uniref:2-dehydropantoate 2-reductase n=1 Tax=Vibrio sonorensis TaxID=1004316 RepID=UPI0008DAB9E7|nr:2-dehydropantoate 2-reductase [Vibrio sonorensis]